MPSSRTMTLSRIMVSVCGGIAARWPDGKTLWYGVFFNEEKVCLSGLLHKGWLSSWESD